MSPYGLANAEENFRRRLESIFEGAGTFAAENIFAPAVPVVQTMGPETAGTDVQAGPHGLLFRAPDLGFR